MENPLFRGLLYNAIFTAVFTLMSYAMKANGAAHPLNPAWILISGIRNLFFYSWVLLLSVGVLLVIVSLFVSYNHEAKRKAEEKQAKERERLLAIQRHERFLQEERSAIARAKFEAAEKERQSEERKIRLREQIEQKKRRSPEEAVESALDEFG